MIDHSGVVADDDTPELTEVVVFEANPGRYVVQSFGGRGWEDEESFDSLNLAKERAKSDAALFIRPHRVVDRGES